MTNPNLRAMFDEWFRSVPRERRPMEDSAHELLIDAWIAGFAKHNEITCAARSRSRSKKQKIEDALRQSDLTAQISGRDDIEYGHHESLPRGEHVANPRKVRA